TKKPFWLRRHEVFGAEKCYHFFLGFLGVSHLIVHPHGLRNYTLLHLTEKPFNSRCIVAILSPPNPTIQIHLKEFVLRNTPVHSIWWPRDDAPAWACDRIGPRSIKVARRQVSRCPRAAWVFVWILVARIQLFGPRHFV